MTSRVVLLVTSPRLPAGLLTAASWDLVRTHPVLAAAESDQTAALRAAGADVRLVEPTAEAVLAAADPTVVWLAGPGGDPDLARELGLRLARQPGLAELELMYGSWDPPGARLLDAVAAMDRLVSPGGDPWKRQQTHETLAHFLLEEAYEAYDAIVAGDRAALREELGDVLLQVVLHARMAEDGPDDDSDGSGRWSGHCGQLGADQEGREGAGLGDGRHRAVPAGIGARDQGAVPGTADRHRRARPGATIHNGQ